MRLGWFAGLVVSVLAAQVAPPAPAVTRGVVLERDSNPTAGEFSIRIDTFEVLRYRFDARTLAQRDTFPIQVPLLRLGERVEVVSDAVPGSLLRYARTVHVLSEAPQQAERLHRRNLLTSLPDPFGLDDSLFSRGDLALSGIIERVNAGRLVLRTRQGERTVLLRDDTRYLDNGEVASADSLRPNMRVFIRAGRNLYDEFEGYQVVWGQILEPK